MYKQRPVELLDVIIANKSFSSMVDQLDMLQQGELERRRPWSTRSATTRRPSSPRRSRSRPSALRPSSSSPSAPSEKAGVEGALAARRSLLRGVKAQIAALEAEQAAAARQAAVRSGGYVLTAVPVNPDTSSVVAFAESFVGKVPYVWGGASPGGLRLLGLHHVLLRRTSA